MSPDCSSCTGGSVMHISQAVFGVSFFHEAAVRASGELKGGLGPCCLPGLGLWVEVTRPWLLWPACWVCPLAPLVLLLSALWLPSCGAGCPLSLWLAFPASAPGSNLGSGARLPGRQRSSFHPVCDCLQPLNPRVPRVPLLRDGESQVCASGPAPVRWRKPGVFVVASRTRGCCVTELWEPCWAGRDHCSSSFLCC